MSRAVNPPAPGSEPRRRRRVPTPVRRGRRLSLAVWALLGCGLFALVWQGFRQWEASRLTLRFVGDSGPVPALELTFYPDQLAFVALSPPPPLGHLRLDGTNEVIVGKELVPERAVVTFRGEGIGCGSVYVTLGKPNPPIRLRPPRELRGRVGREQRLWGTGWTMAALQPLGGAEVLALAGDQHGVPLATAVADAEGRFVLPSLDSGLAHITLRVKRAGYVLHHQQIALPGAADLQISLVPASPILGRVVAPPGFEYSGLRVLARGLPGVHTEVGADGSFQLDHVDPDTEPRLLLHGLSPEWAYLPVRATRSATAVLRLEGAATVRGHVIDHETGVGMVDVLVWSGDGVPVRTDGKGRFVLERLLPGTNEITAQWTSSNRRKRLPSRLVSTTMELQAGQRVDGLVLSLP